MVSCPHLADKHAKFFIVYDVCICNRLVLLIYSCDIPDYIVCKLSLVLYSLDIYYCIVYL